MDREIVGQARYMLRFAPISAALGTKPSLCPNVDSCQPRSALPSALSIAGMANAATVSANGALLLDSPSSLSVSGLVPTAEAPNPAMASSTEYQRGPAGLVA